MATVLPHVCKGERTSCGLPGFALIGPLHDDQGTRAVKGSPLQGFRQTNPGIARGGRFTFAPC
jgi:hypothetical protein